MINVNEGCVEVSGDIVDLTADIMVAFLAVVELFEKDGMPKEIAEHLLKNIMCSNIEGAKVHGFDIEPNAVDKFEYKKQYSDLPYTSDHYDKCVADDNSNKETIMELSGDALTKFLMGMGGDETW